jgi:hypothetical protein
MASVLVKRSVILESQDRIQIMPAENTWKTPASARRKARKLRVRLAAGIKARGKAAMSRCSFLTLTVGQATRTQNEAYGDMIRSWNSLKTWWSKKYPNMKFFRVTEVHESGFPHFHLLLIGAPYIAQKQIAKHWARLLGQDFAKVDIRKVKNNEHAINYVTKYLFKQSEPAKAIEKSLSDGTFFDSGESPDTYTLEACESPEPVEPAKSGSREIAEASWWGARVRPWSSSRGLLAAADEKAPAWWDSLSVKPRVTSSDVERLASARGMDIEICDDVGGFYKLVRDPDMPEPENRWKPKRFSPELLERVELARVDRKVNREYYKILIRERNERILERRVS